MYEFCGDKKIDFTTVFHKANEGLCVITYVK